MVTAGFVVIVLLISWSGVKAIDTNFGLQKQISGLQQQDALLQLSNTNAQLSNEYYNTSQYLELAARENLGLAAPGEKELVVPADVALAHTVTLAQDTTAPATKATAGQPTYVRHFQDWVDFFLHRGS